MNFGREIQDFIQGFGAGWDMSNKREEREWERERRKMAQEDHTYRRERDSVGDDQWEQGHQFRVDEFGFRKERAEVGDDQWERTYDRTIERDAIGDQQWSLEYDRWVREQAAKNNETVDEFLESEDGITQQEFDEFYRRSAPGAIDDNPLGDGAMNSSMPGGRVTQGVPTGGNDVETRHASLVENESGGNWRAQNDAVGSGGQTGHFGRLQFGQARLQDAKRAGVIPAGMTPQQFMNSPDAQRAVENWHFSDIDRQAERLGLNQYIGQEVGGVRISPDAIRAMAHLGGIGGAQKFLQSGGRHNPRDRNGTSLLDYARRHGGGGQRTAQMARGGLVIPDDEEDEFATAQPQPNAPQASQTQVAVPEEDSMPAPRYAEAMTGQQEEPTDDPNELARRAVRDGLIWAQNINDMALSEAVPSPEMQRGAEAYNRGYGATQQQLVRQAQDLIDPDHEMPRAERNLRSISAVYEFYLDRGDFESAQAAAGQLVQAYRIKKDQFASMSRVAAENGDIEGAIKAATAAYDFIPNNRDLIIEPSEDGTYSVRIVDNTHGETVVEQTLSQEDFLAAASDFSLGNFDEEILAAVGAPGPQFEGPNLENSRATEAGTGEVFEMELADSGLSQSQLGAMQDVATSIAGIEQNGMAPGMAARFVTDLFAFDANDPANQAPNFEVKDIPRNNTHKLVIANGQQAIIPNNGVAVLQQAREEMAGARQAEYDEGVAQGEFWDGVLEKGAQAAQDFGGRFMDNTLPGVVGRYIDRPSNRANEEAIPETPENFVPAIPEENAGANDEMQRLLEVRRRLLADPSLRDANPSQYDTMLARTEDRLRELGYTGNRGR